MALLQEIWESRYADYLRRKFLMRGQLRIQIPGDIQPIIDVDHVELADRFSLGENLFSVGARTAPVAGQIGRIMLRVLAASNTILELELIIASAQGGTSFGILHDGAVPATGTNPLDEDSRNGNWSLGLANPIEIRSDTVAAIGGGAVESPFIRFPTVGGAITVPRQTVLTPGHSITVFSNDVNAELAAHFIGRWRRSAPGEM